MAKVEVQVRSCCCCGLSLGSVFIALYTLLLFSLLTGLATWALNDTTNNGDSSYYTNCELKAAGKIPDNRKLTFRPTDKQAFIIEDSTSYHCSFGLYTEELKYSNNYRYSVLVFNICLFVLLIISSVVLLVGLVAYTQCLLIPWIFLMAIEIVRGFISTIAIFLFSHGNLARIATAIFFLGLQFFHVSILIIIIAKFQRIYNRKKGVVVDLNNKHDLRAYPTATLPSSYAYSPTQGRRDLYIHHSYPYSDYSPSKKDSAFFYQQGHRYPIPGSYPPPTSYPPSNRY